MHDIHFGYSILFEDACLIISNTGYRVVIKKHHDLTFPA